MADLIGIELGNYHIFQDVGHGGMATVYRAYDTDSDRVVALKVLSPYIAQEPKFKARFAQEIKLLLELSHPHIVPVYDYGEIGDYAYIVMPFMTAGTLFQRLWEGPLPLDAAADLLFQISGALDYAHANGVIHRDIKPSNILIDDDGKAMLTDFGFARVDDNSLSITGSGIVGTPMYMSPEQCQGEEATPLSDQYAFGVVLYQMTTGRLPYDGETPLEILVKQATDPLPRPREINPEFPRQVERVLLKALSKTPGNRFCSMAEFEEAFRLAISKQRTSGVAGMLDQPTEVFEDIKNILTDLNFGTSGTWRIVVLASLLIAILSIATLWGDFLIGRIGGGSSGTRNGTSSITKTSTAVFASLLATIDTLNTQGAPMAGTLLAPGELETIVAETMTALIPILETPSGTEARPTSTLHPTNTSTPTLTPTPTFIWIPSPTNSPTRRPPTLTPSPSPSPTATLTPTLTPIPTMTPTVTDTPTPTIFPPPSPWIPTPTPTP